MSDVALSDGPSTAGAAPNALIAAQQRAANTLMAHTPPPRLYLSQMQSGLRVDDLLVLVTQKDLRTSNGGNAYVHMVFRDRSAQMVGRMWQATEAMYDRIPDGGFMYVSGRVETYKGAPQFIVDGYRPADRQEVDLTEFLPQTEHDQDQMLGRVREILTHVRHPDCKALVDEFLHDAALMKRFRNAPAASSVHHAYIGGLLEHTVNLLELALVVVPRYPGVSLDLVLAGLFMHDLGKTYELLWTTAFTYTDGGQLVGHVFKGAAWVELKAIQAGQRRGKPIPTELVEVLQHIILSHHGRPEYGALRTPATPEAVLIHHLDNIDAKLNQYMKEISSDPDHASHWTRFVNTLDTRVYKLDPTFQAEPTPSPGTNGKS